jgi:cyclohexyl-isocyanide hydratase
MVQELCDLDYTKGVQLLAEYDPAPPLNAGSPEKAGEATVALVHSYLGDWLQQAETLCESLAVKS